MAGRPKTRAKREAERREEFAATGAALMGVEAKPKGHNKGESPKPTAPRETDGPGFPGTETNLDLLPPQPETAMEKLDQAAEILELRRQGVSYIEIADMMGLQHARAAEVMVTRLLRSGLREAARESRELDLLRLDEFQVILDKIAHGNHRYAPRAIEIAVKVMQRRAELLGLDAAKQVDVTVQAPQVIEYIRDPGQDERRRQIQEVLDADFEELEDIEQRFRSSERKSLPEPERASATPGSADPGDTE